MGRTLKVSTFALCAVLFFITPVAAQQVERMRYQGISASDFYFTLATEYWTENYRYWLGDFPPQGADPDDDFDDTEYEAESNYEWTTTLTVLYGITDSWQVGVALPVVVRHLERDDADSLSSLDDAATETSLGDIAVQINYWTPVADNSGTIYCSLEYAFPTDTAGEPFDPGDGAFSADLFADRYWGNTGVQGSVGYFHYFDGDFSLLDYGVGAGYVVSPSFLVTLEPGGEYVLSADWDVEERNVFKIEAEFEYTFSDRHSMLLSLYSHLSGSADARGVSLEFSF